MTRIQPVEKRDFKLTAQGRSALRAAVRESPRATQFVKSSTEVSKLTKSQLLDVAHKLGVNVDEVLAGATSEYPHIGSAEEQTGAFAPHFFKGFIEFDIKTSILGCETVRKARMEFVHTPDWAYFDTAKGREVIGWEGSTLTLKVLAEHDTVVTHHEQVNGKTIVRRVRSEWFGANDMTEVGIWSGETWDAIDALIDKDCRRQDRANRLEANASAAPVSLK